MLLKRALDLKIRRFAPASDVIEKRLQLIGTLPGKNLPSNPREQCDDEKYAEEP